MACFLVPASEAVVTTVIEKVVRSKENKNGDLTVKADADSLKVSLSEKLGWLNWAKSGEKAEKRMHAAGGGSGTYHMFLLDALSMV